MTLIQLLFALIQKFVPIDKPDFDAMYKEAYDWERLLGVDEKNNFVVNFYAKYRNEWYVRLLFACSYLPFMRMLYLFTNSIEKVEGESE